MVIDRQLLQQLRATLTASRRFSLVCHRKPDGDAIGSTSALGQLLEAQGKQVRLLCLDSIPQHYRFLPAASHFTEEFDQDWTEVLVMLDCGSDRLSGIDLGALASHIKLVEIDHHPKPSAPATPRLGLYSTAVSSTAELVYEIASALGWPVRRSTATALLTGMIFDTSAFQNSNTSARTYAVAADLLRRGGQLKQVIRHTFLSSIPKLRLWGTAMERLAHHAENSDVAWAVLTAEDIAECGAHRDDIEGLVNFLKTVPGIPVMMLLLQLSDNEIKGSLRTPHPHIDVSKLAGYLGGGGHPQAAGFTVPGRLVRNHDESWRVLPPAS